MEDKLKILKNTQIFKELDDMELGMLAGIMEERVFERNGTIIKMNEAGASMYVIESGGVNIYYRDASGGEFMLRHLKAGEIFGEMAIFDNEPRSALVKATSDTTVFEIPKDKFFNLLEKDLSKEAVRNILMAIIQKLCQRLRFTSSDLFISMGSDRQLTQEEIDELKPELSSKHE